MATKKTIEPEHIEPKHVEWTSIVDPDDDGWYNHVAVASEIHDIRGRVVADSTKKDSK